MKDLDLFDLLKSILKHKVFIIVFVSIVSIAAVTYSLLTPEKWTSTAVIEVKSSSQGGLASSFSGILGSFASNISGLSSSEEIFQVLFILNSREFSEKIINEFNIIDYFKIKEEDELKAMDIALKSLKKIRSITIDEETNFYIIKVNTKDKKLSMDIANKYVSMIENYNSNERETNGKNLRKFLEKRINQIDEQIQFLTEKIRGYHNDNNVISLDEQAASIIENYAKMISQKELLIAQRDFAKIKYGEKNPAYTDLNLQISILEDKILDLESKKDMTVDKYIISMGKLSDLAIEQVKFEMELEINKQIIETIYPQYELAILQEINDTPTINLIEHPREAGLRSEPRRAMICIVSFVLALFISSLSVFIYDLIINNEELKKKVHNLKK